MAAKSVVVLIISAGSDVGQTVACTFSSKGYKIALAARSLKGADSTDNQLNTPSDLSKPNDVVNIFDKVKKVFVSAAHFTPADELFAVPLADFISDTNVNIYNALVAAQRAVAGFAQLPASSARTFIYTRNIGLGRVQRPRIQIQLCRRSEGGRIATLYTSLARGITDVHVTVSGRPMSPIIISLWAKS